MQNRQREGHLNIRNTMCTNVPRRRGSLQGLPGRKSPTVNDKQIFIYCHLLPFGKSILKLISPTYQREPRWHTHICTQQCYLTVIRGLINHLPHPTLP
jgi:hypothetical protein